MTAGGLVCAGCRPGADAMPLSGALVGTLKRLRALSWEEALRLNLAADLDAELAAAARGLVARLMGRYPLSSRFLAQTRRSLSHRARAQSRRAGADLVRLPSVMIPGAA